MKVRTPLMLFQVDAVYVDGANVLRLGDERWAADDGEGNLYSYKIEADLQEQLSQELVGPANL